MLAEEIEEAVVMFPQMLSPANTQSTSVVWFGFLVSAWSLTHTHSFVFWVTEAVSQTRLLHNVCQNHWP